MPAPKARSVQFCVHSVFSATLAYSIHIHYRMGRKSGRDVTRIVPPVRIRFSEP